MQLLPKGGIINASFAAGVLFSAIAMLSLATPAHAAGPVACAGSRPAVTPLGSQHLASLAKLDAIAPAGSGVKAVRSGAWSDPATWGGKTPTGRVIIPSGLGVVFDLASSPALKSVRVEGCLELSQAVSTRLNTELLYIAPGGELLAGGAKSPIPANVTAEIVFPDMGPIDVKVDPTLIGKGLVAASRVRLYGAPKTARAKVASAPQAGSATIKLAQAPNGWRVGDRVIITGTRFIPQQYKNGALVSAKSEDEIRFVKSISGTTLTLDSALAFSHPAPDPSLGAYVVNYSRNIRLATDKGATLPVSQRGHSLYMSTETTIEGVEFFEMGRTNKSVRSVAVENLTSPTPTSNVKGRYPLHLHQNGFPGDAAAPTVRGVAVWGSPGWGVAQHGGHAYLFQNNTWNTFGAGFVAESGNETGAWVENTAIRGIGVNHIVKDSGDVAAFDLGRTGDGFWLQSRLVRLSKNVAVGMTGGMGFVYFHRGNDLGSSVPLTPSFIRNALCTSSAMRFKNESIDKPAIQQFTDNEAIASEVGFHIVKNGPIEPHDIRSILDNFKAWEVVRGVEFTYTSRYTLKNSLLIAAPGQGRSSGVVFGRNTYDLALVNTRIVGFEYGADLSKVSTRQFATNSRYTLAGVTFQGSRIANLLNNDPSDQIMSSVPASTTPKVAFAWGTGVANPTLNMNLYVKGQKTDSSGQSAYPIATDEFRVSWTNLVNLTSERGFLRLANGTPAAVVPEYYSDRIHGDIHQTSFIMLLSSGFALPSKLVDGSAAFQGTLDPKAGPPTPANDSASVPANGVVTIAAFANDKTNDGALLPAGFLHGRNGSVQQLPNGNFEYRPFPDFRGSDSFDYWVRNRQGVVARARVSITVN